MITCCKGCEKRHTACHDSCPDYLGEKAADWEKKQAQRKEDGIRYSLDYARIVAIKKIKREGRRHK